MKRNFKVITLIVFLFIFPRLSNAIMLSERAEISVLTCAPGSSVYAIYGHTAIRVNDPLRRFDVVFNYGVFSFSKPNFVYRFAKGQTDYMLATEYFSDFHKSYRRKERSIYEQVLDLTRDEKQNLIDFLFENAKPENREYRYNFFFDNCATRVRDVIEDYAEGDIFFPQENSEHRSFRKHVNKYQKLLPWTNFGIHITLGSPSDKIASAYEEMFLPDLLMKHFAEAVIVHGEKSRMLVKETRTIFESEKIRQPGLFLLSPVFILSLLFVAILYISYRQHKKKTANYFIDYILLFLTGLAGFVLLWLVFYSEHPAMNPNFNLLWALPSNLLFMFLWMFKKWRSFFKWYWIILGGWMILFIALNFIIVQSFHIGFIIISSMLLTRSAFHCYQLFRLKMA